MSDSSRRRPTTKTADRTKQSDKQSREELSRMYHRDEAQRRKTSNLRQSWERFDDLPEHGRRRALPPNTPRPEQNSRDGVSSAAVPPQPARSILQEPRVTRAAPLVEAQADLREVEMRYGSGWASMPAPPLYDQMRRTPWIMAVVIVVSVAIICFLYMQPVRTSLGTLREPAPQGADVAAQPQAPAPNGEHSILRPPSLTAEQIDEVLREYNSPAAGTGRDWVELGQKYGIDPAYGLAFFVVESTAGTAQGWAGWKPDGSSTHNIGNIICAGYDTCYGRFRDYHSWQEGIEDWYKLISVEYVGGRGLQTVEQIIPIYAPAFENDVDAYVGNVERMVAEWRTK